MSVTIDELRQKYDHYQRQHYTEPDAECLILDEIVRAIWHSHASASVIYSKLNEHNAEAIIAREIAYFKTLGYAFEWKYHDYDTPAKLADYLVTSGLSKDEEEAVMVLPIADAPSRLFKAPQADIRKVTTHEMFMQLDEVYYAVWKDDPFADATPHKMSNWLLPRYETAPESLSIFLVYVDDKPVSYGRVEFTPDNPFASIWGGSTLAEYRGRGIYTQLVAHRLQEAQARGCEFLQVDARMDTSMPILEKLGFQHIATATAYNWSPDVT